MKILFTSDTHFDHDNIIKYCNRPFSSVEEMNETLIENWNKTVSYRDTIYHLGDFIWRPEDDSILKALNGTIIFIKGNHDRRKSYPRNIKWHDRLEIKIQGYKIVLDHYPLRSWNGSFHGSWHLYGHCHGTLPEDNGFSCDVGVDVWDYKPVQFEVIKEKFLSKPHPVKNFDPKQNLKWLREHNRSFL